MDFYSYFFPLIIEKKKDISFSVEHFQINRLKKKSKNTVFSFCFSQVKKTPYSIQYLEVGVLR